MLAIVEGNAVDVSMEDNVRPPESVDPQDALSVGTACQLKLYRSKGKLMLDAKYQVSVAQHVDDVSIRTATRTLRLIEKVTLGKMIRVPVVTGDAEGEHGQFDVLVTVPDRTQGNAVRHLDPLPPRTSR